MRLYLVFCFALISFFRCSGQKEFNYNIVAIFLSSNNICFELYERPTQYECISFENKNVYINPSLEELPDSYNFRYSSSKEFNDILNVYLQIDSLKGIKLQNEFYDKITFKTVNKISESDIIISITPIFELNEKQFCIIQIKETEYIEWFITLEIKNNEVKKHEVMQVLD